MTLFLQHTYCPTATLFFQDARCKGFPLISGDEEEAIPSLRLKNPKAHHHLTPSLLGGTRGNICMLMSIHARSRLYPLPKPLLHLIPLHNLTGFAFMHSLTHPCFRSLPYSFRTPGVAVHLLVIEARKSPLQDRNSRAPPSNAFLSKRWAQGSPTDFYAARKRVCISPKLSVYFLCLAIPLLYRQWKVGYLTSLVL